MNITLRFSNAKYTKHLIARAIVCSMLVVLPSCQIPKLRQAEPGPCLPPGFNGATSNGEAHSEHSCQNGAPCAESSAQFGIEEFYNDPMLICLIHQALVGNRELKVLEQEVQIASNEVLARKGAFLPFLTLGASASAETPSRYTFNGAVESELPILPGRPFPDPLPNYLLGLNFSWQLDIWKQMRNARDAAAQRYLAAKEKRNYFVTRLVAEIAENYYGLMALDKRLETLDKTIELQAQSLKIAKSKKEAGRGTELAVQRFQAEVRKNQSEKLITRQQIVEVENRINFLANRFPEPVARMSAGFFDLNIHALCVGVPAQLLQNRPDIRQAERELAAAGLEVKVARARFYPSLTITAGVGYEAFNLKYLFYPEAVVANVVGNLTAPLINKRAIQADYLTANAKQLQSVYNYQRAILNAFTEVINRLSKVDNYRQSIEIKKQQLESLEASVESAGKLFQNARAEYIEVLFAQRDLLEARMVLIETKREQLSAIVNTYQALGGGSWSSISTQDLCQCTTMSPQSGNLPAMLPTVAAPSSKPAPAPEKGESLPAPRKAPPEPEKAQEQKDSETWVRPMETPAEKNAQILLEPPPPPLLHPRVPVEAGTVQSAGN